jgi:hypothetical protein
MAIIDKKLEFSDAQTETNGSASEAIAGTNVFDMSTMKDAWGTAITNDIGEGNNGLVFNFQVATAVEASVIFICRAYSHTTSAIASGTELGQVSFPAASVAGTRRTLRVPAGTVNRWVGVTYSNTVDDWATAAFDAWLGLDTETPST